MADSAASIALLHRALASVVVGKDAAISLLLAGVVGGGHVLLDDIPGVGKTTLAKALAIAVGGKFARLQLTPDLLPTDITGGSIYNPREGVFHFRPGPVFTNILLADELNRASPRTQSALLEAMAERQVTIDGKSLTLEPPFLVIATQNPIESHGTYPLPEAQLDRFAIQLALGYPELAEEKRVLAGEGGHTRLASLAPVLDPAALVALQAAAARVTVENSVSDYLMAIVTRTRSHPGVRLGVSPRGALALLHTARARALAGGRDFLVPDDVKQLAVPALAHRLVLDAKSKYAGTRKEAVIEEVLRETPVPR